MRLAAAELWPGWCPAAPCPLGSAPTDSGKDPPDAAHPLPPGSVAARWTASSGSGRSGGALVLVFVHVSGVGVGEGGNQTGPGRDVASALGHDGEGSACELRGRQRAASRHGGAAGVSTSPFAGALAPCGGTPVPAPAPAPWSAGTTLRLTLTLAVPPAGRLALGSAVEVPQLGALVARSRSPEPVAVALVPLHDDVDVHVDADHEDEHEEEGEGEGDVEAVLR